MDNFSVDSARQAQQRGELAAWVRAFLASPGSDNAALGHHLAETTAAWAGPIRLRFDELARLAGPPDQPTVSRLTDDDVDTVEDMNDSIDDGWEPPPLIVTCHDAEYKVEDGNHRVEGLRRAGHSDYWAIVGFDDEQQCKDFSGG